MTDAMAIAPRERSLRWVFLLYGLTGFTGLLAEQGFEKYIALLVGATASASAVVIFAYFLGFALGSWLAGELIGRNRIQRPLQLYGLLECLVGLSCVTFTFAFHPLVGWLAPFQAYYTSPALKLVVRFVFGSALVLPTAALMGATFPLVAQVVDQDDSSGGKRWTEAYAVNLAGALAAALLGSYAIIPALGIQGSFWLCFAIGTIVFALTLTLRRAPAGAGTQAAETPAPEKLETAGQDTWLLMGAAFASGLAFFALEIIWTHLIGVAIGCSIYAFSSMLVLVLLGLLLGAFRVRRILEKQQPIVYSRLFQFAALLLVCQFRCWDWTQALFVVPLPSFLHSFYAVELYKLLVAALLIVPSAVILGTIYPQLLASPVLKQPGRSYLVSYVNTFNSIGCLAGALLGILFLIPVVGSEVAIKAIVAAMLLVSALFLWRERPSRKLIFRAALGSALVMGYAVAWKWDRRILTSGINVYFGRTPPPPAPAAGPDEGRVVSSKMVYFHEAAQGGMTTVIETTTETGLKRETVRTLYTNGKFQGDDSAGGEAAAQIGFSVIPSFFVSGFDRALLIGLGTGHSAHALKRVGYRQVDIAEYSPGIVNAARMSFAGLNEHVLDDPSVRLLLEDGRNVLLTDTRTAYDLITIELTSIWFAGATNLYSKEFYELARNRLRPGGVLQQWVQLHHISPKEVGSAIATARAVFPCVSLWVFGGQGMITATDHSQVLEEERVRRLAVLAQGLTQSPEDLPKLVHRLCHAQLVSPAGVERMVEQLRPTINTDRNRWIEYATPRYNSSDYNWYEHNLRFLARFH